MDIKYKYHKVITKLFSKEDEYCHYSGLPSPAAYEQKQTWMEKLKDIMIKWYPVIIAFGCLLYSVTLGLLGLTEEAQYSAHWPGTILLFALVIRQRRRS